MFIIDSTLCVLKLQKTHTHIVGPFNSMYAFTHTIKVNGSIFLKRHKMTRKMCIRSLQTSCAALCTSLVAKVLSVSPKVSSIPILTRELWSLYNSL